MHFFRYFIAIFSALLIATSTVAFFVPFFIISLLKLFPNKRWRIFLTKKLHEIATLWIDFNNYYFYYMQFSRINVDGIENVSSSYWYLIVSNHQSGTDILILQYIFTKIKKLPFLTFFLKKQLKWVPVLGIVWWAMEYPFMQRHSKEYLKKYPHKKGEDLKATIKATEIYKHIPISLVSFVEGTRFTEAKHNLQKNKTNLRNLLQARAGGLSYVVSAMHDEIDSILDVTIVYLNSKKTLWDFFTYQIPQIVVKVREIPIPQEFRQTHLIDLKQSDFREWLNQLWLDKDKLIAQIKSQNNAIH